MTEEEKKALESRCRIQTKEQFIGECRRSGIPDDWYAFSCDRSKPVSIDADGVYYRRIGVTQFAVPMRRWDVAYEELLRYKKEREWERTGAPLRIDAVEWVSEAELSSGRMPYPYVTIRQVVFSRDPERAMLDAGWTYGGYDHYMDYSDYYKTADLRTLKARIVVEFTKRTDDRDAREFGFREVSMRGTYRYPVPKDLAESIARSVHQTGGLSDVLKNVLKQRFGKTLPEDEFQALLRLKNEQKRALLEAVDGRLSEEEQKTAFAEASRLAGKDNPAADNLYGSRSGTVSDRNFDLAYAAAGIRR